MDSIELILDQIARHPETATFPFDLPGGVPARLRPLDPGDEPRLARFFDQLSETSKRFYSVGPDTAGLAREHCEAINRYDKLRFVLESPGESGIIGLIEFSLSILDEDVHRYALAGISLDERSAVRYGLCIAEAYQGRGVASLAFEAVKTAARRMGRTRIILWGGVLAENTRAIRHYSSCGFVKAGEFTNPDGVLCWDMFVDLDKS